MAPHITLCQCFPNFCFVEQPPKQFSSLKEPLPLKTYTGMTTKRQLFAHRDCYSISNCQTKIPTVFLGTLLIFAALKNCYIFIPRSLVEPWMMICWTMVGKHCCTLRSFHVVAGRPAITVILICLGSTRFNIIHCGYY